MTIASEITRINNNIAAAYTAANGKGATLPVTQNSANLATCITSIPAGSTPTDLSHANYIIKSDYTAELLQDNESQYTLPLFETDINTLEQFKDSYAFDNQIKGVYLNGVETISGNEALRTVFANCSNIEQIQFNNLSTISGEQALFRAFYNNDVTSVEFTNLSTISGFQALSYAFDSCTSLTTLSFPALTSTSFGLNTDQFEDMLYGVTGCTVYFPSNLIDVIGDWYDVYTGFGGDYTEVLFDLPETT